MPQDFWDWLGSLGNTIVNGLLTVGQLIYGGLIAIGTFFVALGRPSWRGGWLALADTLGTELERQRPVQLPQFMTARAQLRQQG